MPPSLELGRPESRDCPAGLLPQQGAALLLLLVLIAGWLALLPRFFPRPPTPDPALNQARDALIGFAVTYRDRYPDQMFGYLPCPDRDGDGVADPPCGAQDQAAIGYLPYKTLGLPALTDNQGNCLWYGVAGGFKDNPASATPLNWDTPGQFLLPGPGGTASLDGALAAVVMAPGPPLAQQQRRPGPGNCGGDRAEDWPQYLESLPPGANLAAPLTLSPGRPGQGDNNDRLLGIGAEELFFRRIRLRQDFQGPGTGHQGLNGWLANTQACLQSSAVLPRPSPLAAQAANPDLVTGRIPATCATLAPLGYGRAFGDQLFYTLCASNRTCLTVNGQACTGALVFAGERQTGQTRQTPAQRDNWANYLEAPNLATLTRTGQTLAGANTYAIPDGHRPAAQDVVLCLNPPANQLSFAQNMDQLLPSTPPGAPLPALATPDGAQQTLTLGAPGATTGHGVPAASLSGCAWFGDTLDFDGGLRLYFRFQIKKIGEGFTLVLVDGERNPGTAHCGGGGSLLGYGGQSPNAPAPILAPKIGLELDTRANPGWAAPSAPNGGRNDPDNRHAALVFWGSAPYPDEADTPGPGDDNVHGAGTHPINPATPPGLASLAALQGSSASQRTFHVRLDVVRQPTADGASFLIQAWILDVNHPALSLAVLEAMGDLDQDFAPRFPRLAPTLSQTLSLSTLPGQALWPRVRLGFTNAQSTVEQQIVISLFAARSRP